MKKSNYNIILHEFGDYKESIIYNTFSGSIIKLNTDDSKIYSNGDIENLAKEKITYLTTKGILVNNERDELNEILQGNEKAIDESKVINLTIAPSANCQLGCDYCGQVHTSNKLNEAKEKQIIDRILFLKNKFQLNKISISWYGGEPLIALPSINRLCNDLSKIDDLEVLDQMIVTNGILLKLEVFKKLISLNINQFQITIDGDESIHNERRPLKNKGNSFKIIYNNLLSIINSNYFDKELHYINIRINVDRRNLTSVKELLVKMKNDNIHDKLKITIAPVHSWENELSCIIADKSEIAQQEVELLLFMYKLGFNMNVLPERIKNVCMITSKAGELIDGFGNIYNCTEAPYTPAIQSSQKYLIGNVNNTERKTNSYLSNWNSLILNSNVNDIPCKNCVILPICGGACPKKWVDDKESPCPTYKYNIKDRILLYMLTQYK